MPASESKGILNGRGRRPSKTVANNGSIKWVVKKNGSGRNEYHSKCGRLVICPVTTKKFVLVDLHTHDSDKIERCKPSYLFQCKSLAEEVIKEV